MKKLSRNSLKRIMGGNEQQHGCYMACCQYWEEGACRNGWAIQVAVSSCDPAVTNSLCLASSPLNHVMGCSCFGGPHP